ANAAGPVGGIARFASAMLPRHCAEEWDGARLRPDVGELSFQRLRRRSHERMVKRMVHPDESGKDTLRLEFDCHCLERNARTRKCDRPWSVESGYRYRSIVTRNESQGFIFGQSDGEHRSFAPSARFHETCSQRNNPGRFFDRKDAGDACSCNLTHAMTNNGRRLNAPGFPK